MAANEKRMIRAAAALALAVHLLLLILTARDKSVTSDEPFHIARGASALFSGDFRLNVAHPPLVNLISAAPLLCFRDLQVPFIDPAWRNPARDDAERKSRFARGLLWVHDSPQWRGNSDPLAIIFWTRFPVMLMSVALGLSIFLFTRRRLSDRAGLLALVLYCFSPTALAHGSLVTTDTGSALFIFLFAWALIAHLDRPSRGRLALVGLTFGLAQLSKFTAVLLIPLLPACLFLIPGGGSLRDRVTGFFAVRGPRALTGIWAFILVLVMGGFVIWAGYGFELKSIHRLSAPEARAAAGLGDALKESAVRLMAAVPVPPRTYYYGLSRTLIDTEEHPHPLYFFGRTSTRGWWYYYPALFLIKEPLALLLLIGLALAAVKQPPPLPGSSRMVMAVLGGGMVLAFMFLNAKNIGLRHLLPAYPFLFVGLGRMAAVEWRRMHLAAWALAGWYLVNGAAACPDYLIHFNTLAGGTDGGLQKSVVGEDWGQDIPALAKYTREQGIEEIFYNAYGTVDPRAYGVPHTRFACGERQPGWYAVHLVDLLRPTLEDGKDCYEDLKNLKPEKIVNHTIHVYHLTGQPGEGSPPVSSPDTGDESGAGD